MRIVSETVTVSRDAETVFAFLKNLENLVQLLPQDKISDWQATEQQCSFRVQNATTIELVRISDTAFTLITMESGPKSPFPFTLYVHIQPQDTTCTGYLEFDGKVNPFLKMMVERPLTNLFNHMALRLKEVLA
jgi:carbon monoxide dehydrogenase subunit G